jgi:hypothetical protein
MDVSLRFQDIPDPDPGNTRASWLRFTRYGTIVTNAHPGRLMYCLDDVSTQKSRSKASLNHKAFQENIGINDTTKVFPKSMHRVNGVSVELENARHRFLGFFFFDGLLRGAVRFFLLSPTCPFSLGSNVLISLSG